MGILASYKESNIGIVKITLVIPAGRIHETKKLQSICTAKLIGKGTQNKTAAEINYTFDFYGASFEVETGFDDIRISLTCLKKHFNKLTSLFFESIFDATFPVSEFDLLIQTRKEKLKQILSRNDYLSDRYLGEWLFGKDHPYGYAAAYTDYDNIQLTDIHAFYQQNYVRENCILIIAGDIDESITDLLESESLGNLIKPTTPPNQAAIDAPGIRRFDAPQPLQASIKIGWNSPAPNHPDYARYYFAQAILGGYFGSRLMQLLREEKGYTYGIYTQINMLLSATYTTISTEVNRDIIDDTIASIQSCFLDLQTTPVSPEELNLVKQYLRGEFLRETDGCFRRSEVFLKMLPFGLNEIFFVNLLSQIDQYSAEDVMLTAQQYFKLDQCYTVIV